MIEPVSTAERHYPIHSRDTFTTGREIGRIINEVNQLRSPSGSRDGYDAPPPSGDAITHAVAWIIEMHNDALVIGEEWLEPHVSSDEEGNVVFEWWGTDRKLTVYVSAESVEYIKVERPAVASDLEDGIIQTDEDRRQLWRWLTA
jgi:hypothetical protein